MAELLTAARDEKPDRRGTRACRDAFVAATVSFVQTFRAACTASDAGAATAACAATRAVAVQPCC